MGQTVAPGSLWSISIRAGRCELLACQAAGLTRDPETGHNLVACLTPAAGLLAPPMTYELNGRQYLLTEVGNVLYARALPMDFEPSSRRD
jgi:hypothetical protein